ncbi:Hypothetical protein R9X50_00597600 [Acrodontium crateriforme]|uniref:Uncharacterized protein n=1 Tax=Acrodontium crateriforme TaxID=150365 RepID=A0AAQ3MAT1_9PEZI|nr:Hypothetical protein R9X50_00597600 [Acrodontium crateriforme]
MWRASKIFKRIFTSNGKGIDVGYVSKTDVWERLLLAESIKNDFASVVEKYKDTFKPETVEVVMKEIEHESPSDQRTHFSALELDAQKNCGCRPPFEEIKTCLTRLSTRANLVSLMHGLYWILER